MELWETTVRFFSMADANVRWVVAGSVLLGGAAGGLGTFAFLQRRSLLGDALAHAALPGVALAFLLAGHKDLLLLLAGASVSAWLGALAINLIVGRTRIKQDAALGIVLSTLFGAGIVLMTYIQKSGSGAQSGLDKFLFGQAAAMGHQDVLILGSVAILLAIVIILGFQRFKILVFDPGFARSSGIRSGIWQFVLTTMIVLAVVIGLQAVGVVLMAAMLVVPAAAARQWTDRLGLVVILSSIFGGIAGVVGSYVSFLAPRLPTGPFMVLAIASVFLISILFAPRRGIVSRLRRHWHNRRQMTLDHILKVLCKRALESGIWHERYTRSQIEEMWSFEGSELSRGLRSLVRRGLVMQADGGYGLTAEGAEAARQVVRRHRLWEVYLSRFLELPHDHVHRDAEDMEHVLTPEMERQLEEILERPETDPHDQEIPYSKGEKQ